MNQETKQLSDSVFCKCLSFCSKDILVKICQIFFKNCCHWPVRKKIDKDLLLKCDEKAENENATDSVGAAMRQDTGSKI